MSAPLIAIPALNEAATIGLVIDEVRTVLPHADILVIDDGSTDQTARIARAKGARVLRLPFNVGVGGAMRAAFRFADARGVECLVQVDADGQHIAEHIPDLLAALTDASVVVGARFGPTRGYQVHPVRRVAMRALASTMSRVCGVPITDATSGFRAADRQAIALFAHHYPAEYLGDTVESLIIAARAGLRVSEVPVRMRPRQGGRASQTSLRSALHLGRAALAMYAALAGDPAAVPDTMPGRAPEEPRRTVPA